MLPSCAGAASAQQHAALWKVSPNVPFVSSGSSVKACADLDGDGVADFAMGFTGTAIVMFDRGMVRFWSGATGALLKQLGGPFDNSEHGHSLAAIGDADRDGTPDVAIGQRNTIGVGGGDVASGASYATLFSIQMERAVVTRAGDIDGDGFGDYADSRPTPDNTAGAASCGCCRVAPAPRRSRAKAAPAAAASGPSWRPTAAACPAPRRRSRSSRGRAAQQRCCSGARVRARPACRFRRAASSRPRR